MNIDEICRTLREGAKSLAIQNAYQKNTALSSVANSILLKKDEILLANSKDVKIARQNGMSESLVERLSLDEKKILGIVQSIKTVINQTDPIGEEISGWKTPNGMTIRQVRVPLGVAAIIYESRPNVTADAFCLAYKSGNSILLRGSSSALNSNKAIVSAIKEGLSKENTNGFGIPEAIELAPCENHDEVDQILNAVGKIDVVLPRGGAKLIKTVVEKAKVPVIQTGDGVCHLYVDENSDLEMAAKIAFNAKTQRPGACNAIECIVVHEKEIEKFSELLYEYFKDKVLFKADKKSYEFLKNTNIRCELANEEDFGFEFLDMICAVKTVKTFEDAVKFINEHNTKHSESIVTKNLEHARIFQEQIDAACVYVNASTRFTDGGEFGFGAELGISTQKLHARGPMGIKALTTTKYLIDGNGQTR